MRILGTSLLILALCAPAYANSGKGKKASHGPSNRIKAEWTIKSDLTPEEYKEPDQSQSVHAVDIPVVVAPIALNGRLVNYAFVSIRVIVADKVDTWKMRAKSHFMRDAVVRAAHEHTFGKDGERAALDEEHTIALIKEAIKPWLSEDKIDHIEFLSIDMLNG